MATGYKSIASAEVSVEDGLTVVTGPNGAGKSNFLEAVCFALGEAPATLRASCLKDLMHSDCLRVVLTFKTSDGEDVVRAGCLSVCCLIVRLIVPLWRLNLRLLNCGRELALKWWAARGGTCLMERESRVKGACCGSC